MRALGPRDRARRPSSRRRGSRRRVAGRHAGLRRVSAHRERRRGRDSRPGSSGCRLPAPAAGRVWGGPWRSPNEARSSWTSARPRRTRRRRRGADAGGEPNREPLSDFFCSAHSAKNDSRLHENRVLVPAFFAVLETRNRCDASIHSAARSSRAMSPGQGAAVSLISPPTGSSQIEDQVEPVLVAGSEIQGLEGAPQACKSPRRPAR